MVGDVEEVYWMVWICGLRSWEAGMRRSGGGGDLRPQEADTEHACLVLPGQWNCRAGDVKKVCVVRWRPRLRWGGAWLERTTRGGVFWPREADTECMRLVSIPWPMQLWGGGYRGSGWGDVNT